MAKRFNDARYILQQRSDIKLRDPNIIMSSKRDETFKACESNGEYSLSKAKLN